MLPNNSSQFRRSLKSFFFAWKGIKSAFLTQVNFKIQLITAVIIFILAVLFDFNKTEWIVLILTITAVLTAELINTAIEIITNHLFPGFHETAGKIKDTSAAAVLITTIAAIIIGLILFLPKII